MLEQLLEYDKELFIFLNSLGSETWDEFWLVVTYKFTWVPLYAFLLYLIYRNYGWKGLLISMVLAAGLITATDQTSNLFKDGFQRLRPCNFEFTPRVVDDCGKYSFFSAHAASTMAAAIFIGFILKPYYKAVLGLLIAWSLLVGYSRIYLGVHYPGDVLVGFIMGAIYGYLFYLIQHWLVKKFAFPSIRKPRKRFKSFRNRK